MAKGEDALDVLRSIDTTLKAMLALAQQRTTQARATPPARTPQKAVASAKDLDSPYGDPVVKFNPRDWTGPSFLGSRMSQCSPEYLDILADVFEYFAEQSEKKNELTDKGKPVAEYKRQDAARARGWAKRLRDQGRTTTTAPLSNGGGVTDKWASEGDNW